MPYASPVKVTLRARCTVAIAYGTLGIALSSGLGAGAVEPPGADIHLFADARHAAAGTCFPRFNLELWDNNVPRMLAERRPLSPPANVPRCDPATIDWTGLRSYFRTAHGTAGDAPIEWQRPKLAVTLEGGGSKSAPFALGALAGLHESGLLGDVDLISSVSGGSYAAYFYFSRLIDAATKVQEQGARDPDAWFNDCVPSAYRKRFTDDAVDPDRFCSGPNATRDHIRPFARKYPYQAHIRYYQDVIHWKGGLEEVDMTWSDRFWTYTNVGMLFMQSLVSAPFHFVFSSVFSGPDNSSPSRTAYRLGIERAYGHSRDSWGGESAEKPEPAGGDYAQLGFIRGHTMQTLAGLVGTEPCSYLDRKCRVPLWIVNAASSSGRDLSNWITIPATDALRANFEMTPFGQGSGLYGFVNRPVTMALRDVVGTSAAFFDRDQREIWSGTRRVLAGAAISLLNLEWGTDIPNYNASDVVRNLARITPVPFYHVPAARQRYSPMIHLADAGNTDNLGVLAALRRGARNVIVVASSGDGTGTMESLCRAKNHLELDGTYRVTMSELVDIDQVCNLHINQREFVVWGPDTVIDLVCAKRKSPECVMEDGAWRWNAGSAGPLGYNMWDWPIPVLTGEVRRDESATAANSSRDAANPDPGEVLVARIYLVKPAIDFAAARLQVVKTGTSENPDRLCDLDDSWKVYACSAPEPRQYAEGEPVPQAVAMPCTSIAYALAKACVDPPHDWHGVFPQHDVPFTTLNSNYTLFGAYYDLARHVVSQIGWDDQRAWLKVPASQSDVQFIRPGADRKPPTTSLTDKKPTAR